MRQHRLYKAVWVWTDDNRLSYNLTDKEKNRPGGITRQLTRQLTKNYSSRSFKQETPQQLSPFYFIENIDQNQQMIFRQRYQRQALPHLPHIITMEDIKDVVVFLTVGHIPLNFLELFYIEEINLFLRAIIVYLQLYLKVWEDLVYRTKSYANQRLKHPISVEREILCKKHLSILRSKIGQEYALIIAGEGKYRKFHHMNNTLNRSYIATDMILFEYFSKFTVRVVWVALNRVNFKEIESEVYRLFQFKNEQPEKSMTSREVKSNTETENKILQGDPMNFLSDWYKLSPVIADIFINNDKPDLLLSCNTFELNFKNETITGIDAALKLPEELFNKFGITLGILGLPREDFEPLLTVRQRQKSLEEEEIENLLAVMAEEVKPQVKMYEYIKELNRLINFKEYYLDLDDMKSEIDLYLKSHIEDRKRSFNMWKRRREDYSFQL